MRKFKNRKLHINWRYRFFLFLRTSIITFLGFRFLFDSELNFSLFMSFTLATLQSLSLFAGVDVYDVKKHFKHNNFQSSAYIKVNPFFYCPGRLVILDDSGLCIFQWRPKKHSPSFFSRKVRK